MTGRAATAGQPGGGQPPGDDPLFPPRPLRPRVAAALLWSWLWIALGVPAIGQADTLPYQVAIASTGDARLDQAILDASRRATEEGVTGKKKG